MKKKVFCLFLVLVLITFCGKNDSEKDHVHKNGEGEHELKEDEHKHEEGEHEHLEGEHMHKEEGHSHDHLHVSDKIIKKWGIKYSRPENRDYVERIVLTGIAKTNKKNTFFVNSLVCGFVTSITKDIGDSVKKGDILCTLNSPELLTIKTKYLKAFQDFRLSKENYLRAKSLFKDKAIEKKELIKRETAYKTTLADYFSIEAELKTLGFGGNKLESIKQNMKNDKLEDLKQFLSPFFNIRSPSQGKVIYRNLNLGERIESNKKIFEISNMEKLWVILDAKESDLKFIDEGKKVEIYTDIYPDEVFPGKVMKISEKIDPELRTNKIRVEVLNERSLLKPEMYVRGKLKKDIKIIYLAIPQSALVKLSGNDGVFLRDGDGFKFKPVKVIDTDSDGYVFVIGISSDEQIVISGAFYLKAEYEIKRGGIDEHAGHQH